MLSAEGISGDGDERADGPVKIHFNNVEGTFTKTATNE
jgi:hypothetical protein